MPSSTPLPPILNPCLEVRRTCNNIMNDSNSPIEINENALQACIDGMSVNAPSNIEWDSEGWHFSGKSIPNPQLRKEFVALYILALDAINFCFWPSSTTGLEYQDLAVALTQLAESTSSNEKDYFFSPTNLVTLTPTKMMKALEPHLQSHDLPNINERCRLWNQVGSGLLEWFDGSALKLICACGGNAPRLVLLLIQHFGGFRDECLFNNEWCAFYKRAQICVGDWNAALQLNLRELDQLTTFADYRVPQLLRHSNILEYNAKLSKTVDNKRQLSLEDEVFIRAATVVAVDKLVDCYNATYNPTQSMTAVEMDWHLWQVGERLSTNGEMKPHHRVQTIFY